MGFIQDFKDFAFKGNLLDMAVGIIMGGAVAAVIQSFLKNIISPLIARVAGVPDLSSWTQGIGGKSPKLNEAGEQIVNSERVKVFEETQLYIGTFIQNTLDFVILAFVIFIALKIAAKWMKAAEEDAPPAADIVLLTEIRDALKK